MSKKNKTSLENLIFKLSRSEKRHFKLIIQQTNASNDSLFYQIYQLIEKDGSFDKSKALKTIKGLKPAQISNLKKQAYTHILEALRSYHKSNSIELSLRAEIDNGKLLYNKSLYQQSLHLLHKAKQKALKSNLYNIALEIVEFEKYIESQHITNAHAFRAKELVEESENIKAIVDRINSNLNMSLNLYDQYLKQGFVKNEASYSALSKYFNEITIPYEKVTKMVFFEQLYLIQAYVWYNYMIQHFAHYYKYTSYWVQLFSERPSMILLRPTMYLKGLHNLLTAQYNLNAHKQYLTTLDDLIHLETKHKIIMDHNITALKQLYYYIHRIDLYFWEGDFHKGVKFIKQLENDLGNQKHQWDIYRVLNFYFKIASMYFGTGDNTMTIHYLNKILNAPQLKVHSELYAYAMILQAMAQYEMGNTIHLEYFIKSIFRHLKLKENLQLVELEILKFVRRVPALTMDNYMDSFINFKEKLEILKESTFEKRAFYFLDIISWLDSKIHKTSIARIIQKKFTSI